MKDARLVGASTRAVVVLTGAGIKNAPPPMPPPVHLDGSEADMFARVAQVVGN
jgi:hypothetical protein